VIRDEAQKNYERADENVPYAMGFKLQSG